MRRGSFISFISNGIDSTPASGVPLFARIDIRRLHDAFVAFVKDAAIPVDTVIETPDYSTSVSTLISTGKNASDLIMDMYADKTVMTDKTAKDLIGRLHGYVMDCEVVAEKYKGTRGVEKLDMAAERALRSMIGLQGTVAAYEAGYNAGRQSGSPSAGPSSKGAAR